MYSSYAYKIIMNIKLRYPRQRWLLRTSFMNIPRHYIILTNNIYWRRANKNLLILPVTRMEWRLDISTSCIMYHGTYKQLQV